MEVPGRNLDTLDTVTNTEMFCEPCEIDNSKSPANGGCRECKEYMCNICFKHHLKSKHSRNHVLLSFDEFSSLTLDTFDNETEDVTKCGKHENENVKFHCRSHDVVGCGDCMVLEHKSCDTGYIKDLVDTFVDGDIYKAIAKRVEVLEKSSTEYRKLIEKGCYNDELERINEAALKNIKEFRLEVNRYFDDAEANILSRKETLSQENTKTLTDIENDLQLLASEVGKMKQMINTQLHSDNALFINVVNNKSKLSDIEEMFKNMTHKKLKKIEFVRNEDLIKLLKSSKLLGSLKTIANGSKEEKTFSYTLENISNMIYILKSPEFMVQNLPWNMAMQRTNNGNEFGFFLQCNAESDSTSWSCEASAELRLINQDENDEDWVREMQQLFSSKENSWGFRNVFPWKELLDPANGFCKDDKVILQVKVKADAPKGVSLWEGQ